MILLAQNRLLREALARILCEKKSFPPDVFVIGFFTTNRVHLEFAREVQQRLPSISLVTIGVEPDVHPFLLAIREGAKGYLAKYASALEVVAAMPTVPNGARFVRLSYVRFLPFFRPTE